MILRKMIKTAFVAVCAIGISASAIAEGEMAKSAKSLANETKFKSSVMGQVAFGQVNPNVKDASGDSLPGYLDVATRLDFRFQFTSGPMFAKAKISQRYQKDKGDWYHTVDPVLGRNFEGGHQLQMGNVAVGVPFGYKSGQVNTHMAVFGQAPNWCCSVFHGVKYKRQLNKSSQVDVAFFAKDTLRNADGQTLSADYWGTFGPLAVRVAYESATYEDTTTAETEGWSSSRMLAGGQYSISDTMSVSLDYWSKVKATSKEETETTSNMPLVLTMKKLGPGDFILTYATEAVRKSDDSDYKKDTTWLNLVYNFPVSKGSGYNLMYLDKKTVVNDGDPTGPTFIGGGLYMLWN